MSPIEIRCIKKWSEGVSVRGKTQEGEVTFDEDGVTFQVKPGESSMITSPDKVRLFLTCNQKDDGGEITCSVPSRRIRQDRIFGINILPDEARLTHQLQAGGFEIVSIFGEPVAEIRHVPSKRKRDWLGRKR